ncbi:MAG: L-rhamnose mutarotase [Prevotella sp.]
MEENKTNGYPRKEYKCAVKRYCQTMELRNDDALIAKYREAHDKEHFWDEIKEGIRQVGILEMEIYILANRLVMIVETPHDFDWDSAMKKLASLPRQAEWEAYVSQFQQCSAEATSDEKWQMMERMFHLYD